MQTLTAIDGLPKDAILSLDSSAILQIDGAEAESFVQGQITADITRVEEHEAKLTAQCDPKGKMVGLGHIVKVEQGYWYVQNRSGWQTSKAQFDKYGVFAKANFTLLDDWLGFAFVGEAKRVAASCTVHYSLPFMPDVVIGWMQVGEDNQTTMQSWQYPLFDANAFDAMYIRAGVPSLVEGTAEQWVPQMVNVQALDGIDFAKGCYLGQETVARTRYLGKNKRQAIVVSSSALPATPSLVNTSIERKLGENWRKTGTILNAVHLPEETWMLAVVPNDLASDTELRLNEGSVLNIHPLPYAIESESSQLKTRRKHD